MWRSERMETGGDPDICFAASHVLDLCNEKEKAKDSSRAAFAPAMRNIRVRFDVVFGAGWKEKLTALLAG
jgi:hypothetical protein